MIRKDLNLFAAYKSGAAKNSGAKLPILIIAVFVLIVGVTFGVLFFVELNVKGNIKIIEAELSKPDVITTQKKLTAAIEKNNLLVSYNATLKLAEKNFKQSLIINSELLSKITSSMPSSSKMSSLTVGTQSVQISCTSPDMNAPVIFTQSLRIKNLFKSITYDGVTKDEKGSYIFILNCTFKEGVTP